MDFAIRNPVLGHSSHIDEKAQNWGGFSADILSYLSDINKLEQFADCANNAQELSDRLEPFLDNAKVIFEAMEKLTKGQLTWTELRKQYGSHVAMRFKIARPECDRPLVGGQCFIEPALQPQSVAKVVVSLR